MAHLTSQPSCASTVGLGSSHHDSNAGASSKVKLRLCYGGRFEKTANNSYKFVGGEYFNESIPYGIRYSDFMFKLSEKFRTAVSVKYHAPGEELVPDQLISVQDDADLQELIEDYLAHLQRPGTPCKTFRIKVFVFMAAEEPLTPDEIMEGQHFFSECQLSVPARLNAVRLLDGRSSFGSTLSSVGTPSTRHQDLSAGDWPVNSAGQALGLGQDELEAAEALGEQELLERMRSAVSCNPPQRMRQQQRRLTAFSALHAADGGPASAAVTPEQLGPDEEGVTDSAFEEEQSSGMPAFEEDQISREMEEVLQAIDAQQQQQAQQGGQREAAHDRRQSGDQSGARASQTDYAEAAANGRLHSHINRVQQQLQHAHSDSADSLVRALPSHISDFGDSVGLSLAEDSGALLAEAAAVSAPAPLAQAGRHADTAPAAAAAPRVSQHAAAGADEGGAPHLPSHISAFGDDLGPLSDGRAMLSGGGDLDDGFAGDLEPRISGGQLGYARPRTQDSSFSLDGGAFEGEGLGADAAGGINAERTGSGDSLTNLPKLQPVHRLAKPDLKIVQRIGEGAFGEVSVAKAPLYGTVAVKWLKSERFTKHFASFGREAALLADLNHPNVLRFYGVVTESVADSTVIGIMTEYIRGGSMSSFLRMSRTLLPLRVRCELALGAANGLAYLHELRIVHFDLKPDNLLLDAPLAVVRAAAGSGVGELPGCRPGSPGGAGGPSSPGDGSSRGGAAAGSNGGSSQEPSGLLLRGGSGAGGGASASPSAGTRAAGGSNRRNSSGPGAGSSGSGLMESCELPVVKVADFGLSKHKLNSTYVSSCRDLRGTLPYMAPELVSDPERVCEKADVWSLGVVMWEMMTRQTPFQDLAPQQILLGLMCGNLHLDIPEWCEPEWRFLLEACMELNPNNRPTMRELARQLEAIRDQQLLHEQELEELEAAQHQQQQQQGDVAQRVSPAPQQPLQEVPQPQELLLQRGCQVASPRLQAPGAAVDAPVPGVLLQQLQRSHTPQQQHQQQEQLPSLHQQQALPPSPDPRQYLQQHQQFELAAQQQQHQHYELAPLQQQHQHQQHQQQQFELPPPQQQQQQLPAPVVQLPDDLLDVCDLGPAVLEAAAGGPDVYGAVCEHYWPQHSPMGHAAADAAYMPSQPGLIGSARPQLQQL